MRKMCLSFLMGGAVYTLIEILYKRKTHISMFLAGGLALCLINLFCTKIMPKKHLFVKCLTGSAIISTIELITGLIVNNILKLNVWDYSELPLNFKGQICLLFSFLWFLITIPAIYVSKLINKKCDQSKIIKLPKLPNPAVPAEVIEEKEAS